MKDFRDDPPPAVEVDQRQQVGKKFRTDCAFDAGECRHRTSKLDREVTVTAQFAPACGRGSFVDDGK